MTFPRALFSLMFEECQFSLSLHDLGGNKSTPWLSALALHVQRVFSDVLWTLTSRTVVSILESSLEPSYYESNSQFLCTLHALVYIK